MNDRKSWYAGIDWASKAHHVRLIDGDGRSLGERIFKHDGEGLAAMADWLMATSGAERPEDIAVAIEVPHGPVVETLLERGFAVHALNPKQMDRFRDRYSPAGAKDDSRDALVMASALRTDPHCFRRLAATDPLVVELREWSRIAEQLGEQRTQQANRLRGQLWRYFPAFLDLDADLAAPWMLELWNAVPTPDKARRVSNTTIANILKRNRIRRFDAEKLLAILRQPHIPVAPGTAEAAQAHIALLVENLRLINRQITQAHHRLDHRQAMVDVGDANQQVNYRLGAQTWHRRTSIMFDCKHQWADRRPDAACLFGERARPERVMVYEAVRASLQAEAVWMISLIRHGLEA